MVRGKILNRYFINDVLYKIGARNVVSKSVITKITEIYIDMKRLKILVLATIGWLYGMGVSAQKFKVDGIYYYITSESEKTVGVTRYTSGSGNAVKSSSTKYSGDITIPQSVPYEGNTYRVTSIRNSAFEYCYDLTSVEIPNSVTSIEWSAFYGCI